MAQKDFGVNIRLLGSNKVVDKDGNQISITSAQRNAINASVLASTAEPVGADNPLVSQKYVDEKVGNMSLRGSYCEVIPTVADALPITITHGLETEFIQVSVWCGGRLLEADIEKTLTFETTQITVTLNASAEVTYTNVQVVIIGLEPPVVI